MPGIHSYAKYTWLRLKLAATIITAGLELILHLIYESQSLYQQALPFLKSLVG